MGSCGRLEPQYLPPRPGGNGSGGAGAGGGGFGGSGSGGFSSGGSYGGGAGANIPILRYENVNNGDGTYRYK